MKSYFVCLANSKKYQERCIAGVELKRARGEGYDIIYQNSKVRWIRPVSNNAHGSVAESLVKDMKMLDVYEIEIINRCPQGYQSENVKFNPQSLKKVAVIDAKSQNLDLLAEKERRTIFLNRGKAVPAEKVHHLDYSLILVKVSNPKIYWHFDYLRRRLRIKFDYFDVEYDLPITDTQFLALYSKEETFLNIPKSLYLTVSLGINYEEWHYKLAAGVISTNRET